MELSELSAVPLVFPADCNVVVGQSHFIKTVEDLYEVARAGHEAAIAAIRPGVRTGDVDAANRNTIRAVSSGSSQSSISVAAEASNITGMRW